VLASVVAVFFYLRIALTMLTARDDSGTAPGGLHRRVDVWSAVVLVACVTLIIVVGVVPGTFVHWARDATFLL
jgi:NADH:ubiquinone oxidoreductase subunit 2 (subunit N)